MSLGSVGKGQARGLQLRRLQREGMRYKNNYLCSLLIHTVSCQELGRAGHTRCIQHGPENIFPWPSNVSKDTRVPLSQSEGRHKSHGSARAAELWVLGRGGVTGHCSATCLHVCPGPSTLLLQHSAGRLPCACFYTPLSWVEREKNAHSIALQQ